MELGEEGRAVINEALREHWGLSPATAADLQEIADTPDYWGIGPEGGLWVRPCPSLQSEADRDAVRAAREGAEPELVVDLGAIAGRECSTCALDAAPDLAADLGAAM
jgi:hypothetical protein